MRISFSTLAGCILLSMGLSSSAAEPAERPTAARAETAAVNWIEGLGKKGLAMNEVRKDGGFVMSHTPSALGRVTLFRFQQPGWWLDVVCKGEHMPDTPVETLQKNFWYAALNQLPTPGLDLPGWEVRPQTPKSKFEEGVEFLELAGGKLKLRIQTNFFALYGQIERDPAAPVLADAPSPPGTYFQIRREFPLNLTLEAPCSFEK